MRIGIYPAGTDAFDLRVNYGGLRYETFFGRSPDRFRLPNTPPPAASGPGKCACPSCASQGWYAQPPHCKYWRAHCDACEGSRDYLDFSVGRPPRRVPCDACAEAWREDVAWFRFALRSPRAAAQQLRDAAARARAALQEAR
ncbi:hypothetical protein GCM10027258_80800 [Amycolatopsis stemonae]